MAVGESDRLRQGERVSDLVTEARPVDTSTAILIPVYNEGQVVADVIRAVRKQFRYVVCVDDGSRDNSAAEIVAGGGMLVQHPINLGQGAALQTAIEFARALPIDYFCTFDADGQHRLEDVQRMLAEIRGGQYDVILGSRFTGHAENIGKAKRALLKAAVAFSNATTGLKLTDTHNGLRVFNRAIGDSIQLTSPDMSHASEFIEFLAKHKYRYLEIPVTIEYTEYSRNKGQSMINAVNIAFDALLRRILR